MPITCVKTQTSAHLQKHKQEKDHLPLLIPRIFMSINHKHLQQFCSESLGSICKQYAIPEHNSTVQCLRGLIQDEIELLALFFLLFDIDTELKHTMMESDTEPQRRKIGNFSMNLRKHIIPQFLTDDSSTPANFVTRCSDAWSVA